MADKKISQLPAATTPLAGTEVLPIVQGGTTDQVSVANLTAGRAVSATQYTSTIATGTAPLVVTSTTEVANLKAATATLADSATTANAVKSNATTGVLQITGPAAASTRVMTTPDANFTVARTDASQTFTGNQVFSNTATAANFNTKYENSTNAATNIPAVPQSGGYSFTSVNNEGSRNGASLIRFGNVGAASNFSACWIGAFYNTNYSGNVLIFSGKKGNNALSDYQSALNAQFQQDSISFYTTTAGTGDTTEQINIDSSGNTKLVTLAGTGNRAVYSTSTGVLTNSSSDKTLKTDDKTIEYGLSAIQALRPISFKWIDEERFGSQREIGFIAQEMQTVVPEVVGTNNDKTLSIDYAKLTAVLVKAVQELKAEIDDLKTQLVTK